MMCEIPSNAILADRFLEHFDGFSIGSNDMTQLTLGLDRDAGGAIAATFDERDDAVKAMLAMAITACRKAGKYVGICGQGPSDHPDLAAVAGRPGDREHVAQPGHRGRHLARAGEAQARVIAGGAGDRVDRSADGGPPAAGAQWAAMKPPPPLVLVPRRSRLAAALIVVSHAATAVLLLALPLPWAVRVAGAAGILVVGASALRQAVGGAAPSRLVVGIDRRVAVTTRDGRTAAGDILADSFVGPRLITVVWRPDGARRARTLVVLPDSLAADDLRRLRVALRYGRVAAAGPPASGVDAA